MKGTEMRKRIVKCLLIAAAFCTGSGSAADCSAVVSNVSWRAHGESDPVTGALPLDYVPDGNGRAVVSIDGQTVVDSAMSGTYYMWQPQATGTYAVVHSGWSGAFTASYVVTNVASDGHTALTVLNVVACQRWPWNGLVDIDYTIAGESVEETVLAVRVTDGDTGRTYVPANFLGGVTPPTVAGRHRITWDTAADGLALISSNLTMKVSIVTADYCVIDLSGGANATNYPVSYLPAEPAGGWTDEYKMTKLVLRRVEAGSFIMGDDQTDESHRVTLTKPFYVGVFEVTQKQWELVMGSNPSQYKGNTRPVEYVSYNMIRGSSDGTRWPVLSAVDATSFLGRLRAKTGLDGFDLPTEAQWEYACRAGKTSAYNSGGDAENDLKTLGRYYVNQSDGRGGYTFAHTTVGSYLPNVWGLYDMHGNVWEWCLDWYGYGLSYGVDPSGSSSGSYRVKRGGSWYDGAGSCTSAYRSGHRPSYAIDYFGFRLVRTLNNKTE